MARTKAVKPIAAFDLDGSFIREHLLALLFDECAEIGIFRKVAELHFKEARLAHRDRKISFEEYDNALITLFMRRIHGKLKGDVELAAKRLAAKHRDWLYLFSKALLERLRRTHTCITVTGAMDEVVRLLAPYWGFEHVYATELAVGDDGRYTGKHAALPVIAKKQALTDHLAAHGGTLKGSVAIGDSGSDVPLLESVERPIAFNPNATLADDAERRGWPIVLERKDNIYVLAAGGSRRFTGNDAAGAVDYVLGLRKTNPA